MKLSFRDIEPFVKAPNPAARVILVYGPDNGLVKERAATMGKTVIEDLNDPFNAVTINASQLNEDPARLQALRQAQRSEGAGARPRDAEPAAEGRGRDRCGNRPVGY
mgnify:CR=1 FL=1